MKSITIENEVYDIPTRQASAISNAIAYVWEQTGRPESPLSESGEKVMKVIIATWEDTFPTQAYEWYKERQLYQSVELDIHTQVKNQTGRSLASYPTYIYKVMRKTFPKFRLGDRKNVIKLVKRYPMFQMAVKV